MVYVGSKGSGLHIKSLNSKVGKKVSEEASALSRAVDLHGLRWQQRQLFVCQELKFRGWEQGIRAGQHTV